MFGETRCGGLVGLRDDVFRSQHAVGDDGSKD